jgi:predicted nucleotidyltransferase
MATQVITDPKLVIPTEEDFKKILKSKILYEAAQKNVQNFEAWKKANFNDTPWGITWPVCIGYYNKAVASYNKVKRKGAVPQPKVDVALRYLIVAVAVDWPELIDQLKRAVKNWGYSSENLKVVADIWKAPENAEKIAKICESAIVDPLEEQLSLDRLTEAIEKHDSLNSKLFTKEEMLKDKVRDKMLEIVDTFLDDLKEQDIKIKVDDILFIGSNASYNYTKDSDIDLHILANAKAADYDKEVAAALYGAYRTIFNKQLDIKLYDIPLEVFVETEDSARVSNGVYSVKKNKWIKKPVQEDIPEYDKNSLDELVSKWEVKCKDLIDDIKADKLEDEKKVVKMLEDIYEKLRKKGIAKGEYSIENLAFKELRNKGYLDQFKDYRNELVSKRLSLEETLDWQHRRAIENQLAQAAETRPQILDNGVFYVYNLKAKDKDRILNNIRKLPFVIEAYANETNKYDFSNPLEIAMNNIPKKYFDIRGKISY